MTSTPQSTVYASFLGTSPYSACTYSMNEQESPEVAFVQTAGVLLFASSSEAVGADSPPPETRIFATPEARDKNGQKLEAEFARFGLAPPVFIDVPSGKNQEEFESIIRTLGEHLAPTDPHRHHKIVFDVTHGFRSQPVSAILALSYLTAAYPNAVIEDLLYGAFDLSDYTNGARKFPLVSLLAAWNLVEWAGAFRTFRDTGDVRSVTDLASDAQNSMMRRLRGQVPAGQSPQVMSFASALKGWQNAASACAVESLLGKSGKTDVVLDKAGQHWNDFSNQIGNLIVPLREEIHSVFAPMQAEEWHTLEGLEAQLALIRWLYAHDRHQQVLTIAREWIITAICWASHLDATHEADRKLGTKVMNTIQFSGSNPIESITGDIKGVISKTTELRNSVNHAWMGKVLPNSLETSVHGKTGEIIGELANVLNALRTNKERRSPLFTRGKTLFSPLGKSPGVLVTACAAVRPDRIAILTSPECEPRLHEALENLSSDTPRPEVDVEYVDDPFTGFNEAVDAAQKLYARNAREHNVLNIVGGTTALQHGIESLQRTGRFTVGAAIDRRPLEEQRTNPFVVGEWIPFSEHSDET